MSGIETDRLTSVVVEALERTAFVIVDACDEEDLPGPFEISRRTRISISGVADSTVWLDADDGFACELAAGLLGCDSDEVDPTTSGQDAMSELANIVGGSVVVALGGENEEYRLGLPESLGGDADATPNDEAGSTCSLLASDEGAIRVTWCPNAGSGELRAAA